MTDITRQLGFASVDGLAFAEERGRLCPDVAKTGFYADDLGPLLELIHLAQTRSQLNPKQAPWITLGSMAAFWEAFTSPREHWFSEERRSGFYRTSNVSRVDEMSWVAFRLAAQQAAVASGFHRRVAAQLIGAIGEMWSNIYEHCGASTTGLIAFKATPGIFEFVVSDRGMGALNSLRADPQSC